MIALPAVMVFGLATAVLVRSRSVRLLELVVVGLFGFFLAATGLGHAIGTSLDDLFKTGHNGVPVSPPVVSTSKGVGP